MGHRAQRDLDPELIMSDRYEWIDAGSCPMEIVEPGEQIGAETSDVYVLLLGESEATSLAVEGTPDELRKFAADLRRLLTEQLPD
jgi:hypothetical protein